MSIVYCHYPCAGYTSAFWRDLNCAAEASICATCSVKFGKSSKPSDKSGSEAPAAASRDSQSSNPRTTPNNSAPKPNSGSGRPAAQPSAPQPAAQPTRTSQARDKPPLPKLTTESCVAYYEEPLPAFREVPPADKQLLLVRKLHLCSFTFDFSDPVRFD